MHGSSSLSLKLTALFRFSGEFHHISMPVSILVCSNWILEVPKIFKFRLCVLKSLLCINKDWGNAFWLFLVEIE